LEVFGYGIKPADDPRQHLRRKGLLDPGVFRRRAGFGVLKEMVEAGQCLDLGAFAQRFVQGTSCARGVDLPVLVAVQRENRNVCFLQRGSRVEGQRKPGLRLAERLNKLIYNGIFASTECCELFGFEPGEQFLGRPA
jgi:hypothetical protein